MEPRLTLITLGVKNLQRSRDFYQNVFGWQPTESSTEGIVFFALNGVQLALFPQESLADDAGVSAEGSGFRRFALAHNVGSEREVDALVAQLEEKGATVLKRPEKVFWGGTAATLPIRMRTYGKSPTTPSSPWLMRRNNRMAPPFIKLNTHPITLTPSADLPRVISEIHLREV